MHEYLNDQIAEHGDRTLAPKDDPFVWQPQGPPIRRLMNPDKRLALASSLPIALTAQSVEGEMMTWSVLLIAVEGLYLALPAAGRHYGAQFEIWDWSDQAQWGFGEVKGVR